MIRIDNKIDCCGCEACVQKCPKSCISLKFDEQGFRYPVIDLNICVDCHMCETVCPVLNQGEKRKPVTIYGAFNVQEHIRLNSSSGGVFYPLAKYVIENGGVVFGARFDKQWNVEHCSVHNLSQLTELLGSKYVQSHVGSTYKEAEKYLKEGCLVLFSGTPCQIAGLKKYLRKDYRNLVMVDFVCHGVPSPGVWEKYKSETMAQIGKNVIGDNESIVIQDVNFRDKIKGWEKFSCKNRKYTQEYFYESLFVRFNIASFVLSLSNPGI